MDTTAQPLNISKLRTGREKFYLCLVVIASLLIWFWTLFSLYRQLTSPQERYAGCYLRDTFSDTITKTNKELVLLGEDCKKYSQLTEEEKKQVTNDDLIGRFFASISTPILLLGFIFFNFFSHLLAIAYIRMNSIKVGPNQFPKLYESLQRQSQILGLKKAPSMFILMGNGVLNAFATRLVFRQIIVIFSNLAEALIEEEQDQKQLDAVVAHELGHHRLMHTTLFEWLLLPASFIPLLYAALTRWREYSADRVMRVITPDLEGSQRALIKLAGGRLMGSQANIEEFINQSNDEKGFFAWLAEVTATHPHLPKRVNALKKLDISKFGIQTPSVPTPPPTPPQVLLANQDEHGHST